MFFCVQKQSQNAWDVCDVLWVYVSQPNIISMRLGCFLVPWAMDEWDMAWFAMAWGGGGDMVGPRSCFQHTFVSGATLRLSKRVTPMWYDNDFYMEISGI